MDKRLLDMLACPATKGKLTLNDQELWSSSASLAYPIRDGIPVLLESEARPLTPTEIETLKNCSS